MKRIMIIALLAVFCLAAYVQSEDPGLPQRTVRPDQDFEYSLNGTSWQKFTAIDVVIDKTPMPTKHRWVHIKQLNAKIEFIAPLDNHTVESPNTCQFTLNLDTIEVGKFCQKTYIRWQFRIYEGTEFEQIAPASDAQHVYVIDLFKPLKPVAVE